MNYPRRGLSRAATVGIIIAVVVVAAIGAYYAIMPRSPAITTVVVNMPAGVGVQSSGLNFQPATITVVIGVNNTIKWVNQDTVPHTVSTNSGPAEFGNDGTIAAGSSWTTTLTVAGTYHYDCTLHPSWMTGVVIVKSA